MKRVLEIGLAGLLGWSCVGCSGRDYQNNNLEYFQHCEVREQRCLAPKMIFRDNDPRFFSLKSHYFDLFGYKNGEIDFDDERRVYYSGEEFVLSIAVPENLEGSQLNIALLDSRKSILYKRNYVAGEACIRKFSVDGMISRFGQGDFTFIVGYDGKLAGVIPFRIED